MVWHDLEPELMQHENSHQVLAQDLLLAEALPKVWLGAPSELGPYLLFPQWIGRSGCRLCNRLWLSIGHRPGCPVPTHWACKARSHLTMQAVWSSVASKINSMWSWQGTKCSFTRIWRYDSVGKLPLLT